MKIRILLQKSLRYAGLLLLSLALQGGCVMVQDSRNRENQIRHASKTFVEAYMAKRVLLRKESIRDTYGQIYRLQDSIRQSLRDVSTVEELKIASLDLEIREVENLRQDFPVYLDDPAPDDYSLQFARLLESPAVQGSSEELLFLLQGPGMGQQLPKDYQELKALAKARSIFLFKLQEYLNKRAMTAALAYRKWAEVYRQKGIELHEAVRQDKRFTMKDLERIETERLAERYLALSLEYIEKSDSLLAAGKEARNPWRAAAEKELKEQLRLQNLAQKL